MWATWVVAAIALAAAAFMLRFLVALLRESASSFRDWPLPVHRRTGTAVVEPLRNNHVEANRRGFSQLHPMLITIQSASRVEKPSGTQALRWRKIEWQGNRTVVKARVVRPWQSW
jgi:hypothetical protein